MSDLLMVLTMMTAIVVFFSVIRHVNRRAERTEAAHVTVRSEPQPALASTSKL